MKKSFYIRTYGCQMNERDSEAISCLLKQDGYTQVTKEEIADIILFNTCSIREQAEIKVTGKIGILKRLKRKKPEQIIGVLGCMAQNKGDEIIKKNPHVDLVVGTDQIHTLPTLLKKVITENKRGIVQTEVGMDIIDNLKGHNPKGFSASISVMRGCNQFCTYCIVPYVRGREKSRTIADIVAEATNLVQQGIKEITLLGQNVTAYGLAELRQQKQYNNEKSPFAELLQAIHDIPNLERLRFISPHPRYMNKKFIDTICSLPKICKSFHVPLQSGSNKILKAMKRGYTVEEYLAKITAIKQQAPEATFTTDIIVGFPGETEEDFLETKNVMEQVNYDMAYIFKFSPRKGTFAAEKMADDVYIKTKKERNQILLSALEKGVKNANQKYINQTVEVLVEGVSKRNPKRWMGRTHTSKVVIFEPNQTITAGSIIKIKIERVTPSSLFGEII